MRSSRGSSLGFRRVDDVWRRSPRPGTHQYHRYLALRTLVQVLGLPASNSRRERQIDEDDGIDAAAWSRVLTLDIARYSKLIRDLAYYV